MADQWTQTMSKQGRGKFIVIEGLDGSGSTTLVRLIEERYVSRGLAVHATQEPTHGLWGTLIRQILERKLAIVPPHSSQETIEVRERMMAVLFALDRLDHIQTEIVPNLHDGVHVISDRYYLSTYAYQSLHVDLDWLRQLNAPCPKPDLILFLNVPVRVCAKRVTSRWRKENSEFRMMEGSTAPSVSKRAPGKQDLEVYETLDVMEEVHDSYLRIVDVLATEENMAVVDFYEPSGRGKGRAEIFREAIELVDSIVHETDQPRLLGV